MSALDLFICMALVATSAYLSASEVALLSLTRFQLRNIRDTMKGPYKRIKKLLADPAGLLITILVANELLNISLSALVARTVSENWSSFIQLNYWLRHLPGPEWVQQTVFGIAFTAPIVLILCEITPKIIAARANHVIAPLTVRVLSAFYVFFFPIRWCLTKMVDLITLALRGSSRKTVVPDPKSIVKEEEFLILVEEGHREGSVRESELELIRNVFELDETPAIEIATPMSQVNSIPASHTLEQALLQLRTLRFSRVPVSGRNHNEVVGILYSKDLLKLRLTPENIHDPVSSIMKKPLIIPPHMRLSALFRKLKRQKIHMAVIEQVPGKAIALVTMDDVLEALFEDLIPDEDKTQSEGVRR